ncbi:pyridoxal-phosphate dependent enzyme [Austwickia chelonae]|uniref:pyridoxal-phosphate dependent enzyme n=1 Tax=Austwickia chelonae TaxID=100225 RepID=UPI000E2632A7|nr:pyridoxal-phosphate dependent enzyme [Austwickia chelonae]
MSATATDGTVRRGVVAGYRCATCGATVAVDRIHPWRCPSAAAGDCHHVLHPVVSGPDPEEIDDPNPFVRYGRSLAWWAFARARGMSEETCLSLTREVASGFRVTPFGPHPVLSERLGVELWVKDETGNVGGSHKARHLVGILLHLRAAEELGLVEGPRPPLAIASCGNAAIAAATLAKAARWPIQVYVPQAASSTVMQALTDLGAVVNACPRMPGVPGDPAVAAFRAAVAEGAIPFSVQGPENGLCLDGGRTIGWEMGAALAAPARVVIQVGGGAFAACAAWGLGPQHRIDCAQTEGGAPLDRAWRLAEGVPTELLGSRWPEFMTPWESPGSLADGILDDETYDWQADIDVMRASGGRPIVAAEEQVQEAFALVQALDERISPTGTAGLAALLPGAGAGSGITPGERVVVVFSGVRR